MTRQATEALQQAQTQQNSSSDWLPMQDIMQGTAALPTGQPQQASAMEWQQSQLQSTSPDWQQDPSPSAPSFTHPPAHEANPSASPTRGTPAQQFRSIPQPQQRAWSPCSPPAAFRFTQHQSVVGSPMTPGQHFRGTQPQPQAAASNVRTRSMTPSRQPLSRASVATWSTTAGSPQRPVGPVPPGTPGSPQHPVPGTPIRMTPPEVTLGPPVDESGMPVFSRRFSGQHMKGDGSPSPNA